MGPRPADDDGVAQRENTVQNSAQRNTEASERLRVQSAILYYRANRRPELRALNLNCGEFWLSADFLFGGSLAVWQFLANWKTVRISAANWDKN